MLRSSLVLSQPPSAAQATSLAPRVCVHRARVVAMAAVTAAAAAAAADDGAGGATTGGARRGGRACAVGRGCGVVGPHGEVLMGRGISRCTQGVLVNAFIRI